MLDELGAKGRTIVTVFNKDDAADETMRAQARHLVADGFFVSAHSGTGIEILQGRFAELIAHEFGSVELFVPHSRYDIIAKLHALGHIQSEEQRDDGVAIHGRFPVAQSALFAPFVVTR